MVAERNRRTFRGLASSSTPQTQLMAILWSPIKWQTYQVAKPTRGDGVSGRFGGRSGPAPGLLGPGRGPRRAGGAAGGARAGELCFLIGFHSTVLDEDLMWS